MELLNDIVFRELSKANYHPLYENILWKHKYHSDYWMVMDFNEDLSFEAIQCIQEQCLSIISEFSATNADIEKNTSLLVLNQVQTKTGDITIALENDVFFFKKYILQYTKNELTAILKYLEEHPEESIAHLVLDEVLFEKVKQDINSPLILLYTLVQKLPFVVLEVSKKDFGTKHHIGFTDSRFPLLLDWVDSFPLVKFASLADEDKGKIQNSVLDYLAQA